MPRQVSRPKAHQIKAFLELAEVTESQLAAATGFPITYVSRANRGQADITPGYARACSDYLWLRPKALFRWNDELERELAELQANPWRYWLDAWRTADMNVEPGE